MVKSLKRKITFIYVSLCVIIILVIATSLLNLYYVNNSVDDLLVANYRSINAVSYMMNAIEDQNNSIFNYIDLNKQSSIDQFLISSKDYYKWYNIELSNLTEPGEKTLVDKLSKDYLKYLNVFSDSLKFNNNNGTESSVKYYNAKIIPIYNDVKTDLKSITQLNEKAMFQRKTNLMQTSQKSTVYILLLCLLILIVSLFFARFFMNKILYPIFALTKSVKKVKEGTLNIQAPILSNDEVGVLATEFNKMIKRLSEFENSTKGKLLDEKNKSLAIVKSISDPLIVINIDYKILLINNACEKFFNLKENSVLNSSLIDLIQNSELYELIFDVFKGENKEKSKIIIFKSNNKIFYFNVLITLVETKSKNNNEMVILFQDITNLKEIEKIKTDFISTISHEFKTPLTSIMMGASLIEDKAIGIINAKQQEIISTIKEDGEKLNSLVTNLLQLSKIEWSKSIFDIHACSIVAIIDKCINPFYDIARAKEIKLIFDADDNLPNINADPEKISWVITNLLSNSLKFTNAGDEITIETHIIKNEMIISVSDTGIGIPQEYLSKIFNKFIQVRNDHNEDVGTGLGLTIAKEIVDAHSGRIWCESNLDVGSKFTFTLPLV